MTKRIVFVAPFGLGQKTTVWARIFPLARYLAARGAQVTVLIPPWDTPADAGKCWVDGGVRVINVDLWGGLPLIVGRLLGQIRRIDPDIVHIVKPRAYAGIVQWLLWQRRRCLPGSSFHLLLDLDDWEQSWAPIAGYPGPLARFLAWQEEWGIRHADAITAASHWLVARAGSYVADTPLCYLPNGITPPPDRQDPAMPTGHVGQTGDQTPSGLGSPLGPAVLLFSRFVEVEPAWLAAFWQSLQGQVPGVRLVVAGQALQPGREEHFRAALLAATNVRDRVKWLGFVERETLPALYAGAACAIFPASPVPLNQAKCSVKLATTLLHGVPVVASAVGEQARYGADGAARLVPAQATPAAFAQAVADVLAAPDQQRRLGQQAQARLLRKYDWQRLGQELLQFYRQLGDDPRAG